MIPIDLSAFTANITSPRYDPAYPTGNRPTGGVLLGVADFSNGLLLPPNTFAGASWNTYNATRTIEGDALRMDYPADEGGASLDLGISTLNLNEVFIEFEAKMPGNKGGLKFVKIFGIHPEGGPNGYANCTFGLDYTGQPLGRGSFYGISFGDGTSLDNDTANVVWLDGSNPAGVGRSYPSTAVVSTPQNRVFAAADWGTGYHTFRMAYRQNSGTAAGNEVPNGYFYLEIDGLVFANATGLFNRNYQNSQFIDYISFGNYSQTNLAPFSVYFRNIKVSKNGFVS